MRFKCIKCGTKYRIDNERVRGRAIRVRCRTCDSILKVRDPGLKPAELPGTKARSQAGEGVQAGKIKTLTTRVARPAEGKGERKRRRTRRTTRGSAEPAGEAAAARGEESTATGVAGPAQDRVFYEDTRVDERPLHDHLAEKTEEQPRDDGVRAADMPEDGWFRVLNGKPEGPYKLMELVAQAADRRLNLDDLVWQPSWDSMNLR